MKIITKEEVEQRIALRFPNQPFEIIEYTRITKPLTIKCLTCECVKTYSSAHNFLSNGKVLCKCFGRNPQEVSAQMKRQEVLRVIQKKGNQELLNWGRRYKCKKETAKVKCLICDQVFEKVLDDYLRVPTCPYCENHHSLNHKAFQLIVPDGYACLGTYQGTEMPLEFQHCCGTTFMTSPRALLGGHAVCPLCSKNISKGEAQIAAFLRKHHIKWEKEKTFHWQNNRRYRYDFYCPGNNTIIEFHGEQHYREVPFFKLSLSERQKRDEMKQEEAERQGIKYLIISYKDYRNIHSILSQWFNDYPIQE